MSALIDSTRAELLRLRKWSAVWVVIGAWLTLGLMFGYAFDYIGYKTGSGPAAEDLTKVQLLAAILPANVPTVLIQGTPMFGGALALVLGALVAGNGFGWGTWKTVFTRGPSRRATIGGSVIAASLFVLVIVTLTLVLFLAVSAGIAAAEGQSLAWPSLGSLATSYGAGLLVLEMWMLLGYAVGIVAKGPALAIGLGLVWVLVVENLLRSVGSLLSVIDQFTRVLPGTAGGSLIGDTIGGSLENLPPGVLDVIGGGRALVTVTAYVVGLVVLVLAVVRRRDVT